MAPSTEQAAARVAGSESASWACWSASWSRPSWTRAAALWRAACAWAPKEAAGGSTPHKSTAREMAARALPGDPQASGEGRTSFSKVPTSTRLPLSVVEPQAELDRSRLVALRVDRAERGGAEVRVRSAEGRPVEDVADLRHEPHPEIGLQVEALRDGQVLVVHVEPAHRPIGSRRVAERERTRILPGALVEVVVRRRVETPAGDHRIGPGAVRALLRVEEQAAHVVGHGDPQGSAALVPEHTAEVPAAEEGLPSPAPALPTVLRDVPREAHQEHVGRVVQAEPVIGSVPIDGILDASVDPFVPLPALRAVVLQPGEGVADAVLEPLRELLLQDDLDRVVLAPAQRETPPFDVLILGILPQRLRHVSVETRVGRRDPGRLGGGRIDVRIQERRPQRQDPRIV